MAQSTNPFDMSEMMKAFDPERIAKMWNPQVMMQAFQQPQAQMFDMEQVIKANQQVLRENSEDPAKAKTWLMRSSLLDSVRKEETIE